LESTSECFAIELYPFPLIHLPRLQDVKDHVGQLFKYFESASTRNITIEFENMCRKHSFDPTSKANNTTIAEWVLSTYNLRKTQPISEKKVEELQTGVISLQRQQEKTDRQQKKTDKRLADLEESERQRKAADIAKESAKTVIEAPNEASEAANAEAEGATNESPQHCLFDDFPLSQNSISQSLWEELSEFAPAEQEAASGDSVDFDEQALITVDLPNRVLVDSKENANPGVIERRNHLFNLMILIWNFFRY
jgi:hypothetical protein